MNAISLLTLLGGSLAMQAGGSKAPPPPEVDAVVAEVKDALANRIDTAKNGVGLVVVNRSVKAATGVDAGDRVRVEMELDTEPRTVRVPAELKAALAADAAVEAAFAALSFTHRREYVEWVEEAKREETRSRRIAATVERVREGKTAS